MRGKGLISYSSFVEMNRLKFFFSWPVLVKVIFWHFNNIGVFCGRVCVCIFLGSLRVRIQAEVFVNSYFSFYDPFATLVCKNVFRLSVIWGIEEQLRNESWLPFVIDGEPVITCAEAKKIEKPNLDCVFTNLDRLDWRTLPFNNRCGFAYGHRDRPPPSIVSKYSTNNWSFQSTITLLSVYYSLHWFIFALTQAKCQTVSACG